LSFFFCRSLPDYLPSLFASLCFYFLLQQPLPVSAASPAVSPSFVFALCFTRCIHDPPVVRPSELMATPRSPIFVPGSPVVILRSYLLPSFFLAQLIPSSHATQQIPQATPATTTEGFVLPHATATRVVDLAGTLHQSSSFLFVLNSQLPNHFVCLTRTCRTHPAPLLSWLP
jgi:hypothetical protein